MDLLDRYLNTIRWSLPRGSNAADILAELRDVIGNRIEEREDRLGRPLDEEEMSAVLRDFGHPLVVAARYGANQPLIGPELSPFYIFSLKAVVVVFGIIMVLSIAAHVVMTGKPLWVIGDEVTTGLWSILANIGLVTLIFAVIERTHLLQSYLQSWKPDNLPDLSDLKVKPQSMWNSAFEVAAGIGFILWWVGLIHIPILWTDAKGLTLTPAPVWAAMWTPILALMIARLVYNIIQWARPRWKAVRAVLSVATAAGAIALLAVIYRAGHWISASSATMPADQVADIDRSTNLGIHYAIVVVGVIWAFQCAQELWRLYMSRH